MLEDLQKIAGGHITPDGIGESWYGAKLPSEIRTWDEVLDLHKERLNISPKDLKAKVQDSEKFMAAARDAFDLFDNKFLDLEPLCNALLAAYTTKMSGVIIRAILKSDADSSNPRATIAAEINFMKDKWKGFDYASELPAGMVTKIAGVIAARRRA